MHRTCHKPIPRFQSSSHPPGRLFRRAGFRIVAGFMLFFSSLASHAAIPADQPLPTPTYGINLGNTLEPPNGEGTWGPAATQAVINSIAAQGFNSIRIPCAWGSNADANTYQIDPVYMARVKQVVDWAIAAGLYVVVNDHWDGGWLEHNLGTTVDPALNSKMNAYWTQIATTFAGYDNHLLFAAANEPSVDSPEVMNTLMVYYKTFIDAVRGTSGNNTNRWLVLQSVSEPSWMNNLPSDPVPHRLMVEYHQYTPSLFTIIHTDQTWGNAMYFWGAAYHYSGNPSRNAIFGEEGAMDAYYQQLADQYVSKGIPVMIGEFGAWTAPLSGTEATWNRNSQLYWDKYAAESARAHGINPFLWTVPGDVFDWTTGAVVDQDVVNVVLGAAAPPPPNGAPYAVTGLTATTAGTGQINLSWNAASGATSYNLYRAAESGYECDLAPFATGITGTSFSDTGLNDGTTYYYQIVAVNGSGSSGFAVEAHATTPGINPDPAQFHFETDTQRWRSSGSQISGVAVSSAQAYAGNQSLAVNFNGTAGGTSTVSLGNAIVPVGETVTFHVWIPSGSTITSVETWMQDKNWNGTQSFYGSFTANAWNTFTLTVPTNATTPFVNFGLRFTTSAAWTGTCCIDSISWLRPLPDALGWLSAWQEWTDRIGLAWPASTGATSYNVKRASTSGGPYATVVTGVTGTGYTDTGLSEGATYYYVVSAVNAGGESADSAEASATTKVAAPAAPTGLVAVAGDGSVGLDWNDNGEADLASYTVYRSTTNGSGYVSIASGLSTSAYTDNSVANGMTYYYTVTATDTTSNESGGSTVVSATLRPSALGWLAAWQEWTDRIGLAWPTSTGATSYNVKRATTSGGPYTTVATGVATNRYSDSGLTAATAYYYVVTAVNAGGESATSSEATATTKTAAVPAAPAAPSNLNAMTVLNSQVDLSWTASSGATGYNVKWASVSGGPYTNIASWLAATSYSDAGMYAGSTNYYVVSAVNAGGESADSLEAVAVTPERVAHLAFDETSGTTASDAGPNGFAGTLVNGPVWATGIISNSILLDGVDDYVSLPNDVVADVGNFTISTWVYLNSASSWSRIFDFGSGTTSNMFLTARSGVSGAVRFSITTGGGGGEQLIDGLSQLPTNAWIHVAVTRNGNTGILYVDGVAVGTNSTMTLYPAALGNTTLNYIGKSQYADPYLDGAVDDFKIIGWAWSAYEVATNAAMKRVGTVIGTAGSWNNNASTTKAAAFDGNLNTYFDPANGTGYSAWCGLDLGIPRVITKIRFAPRTGNASRMVGGKFQGSNTADFSSGVVDLHTVTTAPATGVLTTVDIHEATAFRYVRYITDPSQWCNVSEIEFY